MFSATRLARLSRFLKTLPQRSEITASFLLNRIFTAFVNTAAPLFAHVCATSMANSRFARADDDFNNFQSATSAPPLSSASDGFGDSDDGFQSAPAPNEIADMILRGLNNDYSATTNAPQRRPPSPLFSPADPSSAADPTPRSVRDPLPIPPLNISRSKDGKPPVEIDSAAVTKAIANIRLKAPTLARNLDRGGKLERRRVQLKSRAV